MSPEISHRAPLSVAQLHAYVVTEYPKLAQVDLKVGPMKEYLGDEKILAFFILPDEEFPNPTVLLHENPEFFVSGPRQTTFQEIAAYIGIRWKTLRENPLVMQAFVLGHELGHGHDYVQNYVHLADPVQAFEDQKHKELSQLLIPGLKDSRMSPKDCFIQFGANRQSFEAMGIHSPRQLKDAIQKQYRTLPMEKFADDFSLELLRKYWKDLGFNTIGPAPSFAARWQSHS